MINLKSADLTSPGQKLIALGMLGVGLTVLWFILPPILTILTNIWLLIFIGGPLLFLGYNYDSVWDIFKRLSWASTKKLISSDKLWYLWQGYNYLVKENESIAKDINEMVASRVENEKALQKIVKDSNRAMEEHELETNPDRKKVLQVQVSVLDEQFKDFEPRVEEAKALEKEFIDYYNTRVADTDILKIKLEAKAQTFTFLQKAANATKNASRWMKENQQAIKFNESLKQIDDSINNYTADIANFRRNVLPKMNSNSTSRQVDAAEGVKLITEWKQKRLLIADAA